MKKLKQITALIGVIALAGLYISTLVLALIGSEQALNLLKTAVYATIVLPVLLWAYSFIYRMLKGKQDDFKATSDYKNMSDQHSKDLYEETPDRHLPVLAFLHMKGLFYILFSE